MLFGPLMHRRMVQYEDQCLLMVEFGLAHLRSQAVESFIDFTLPVASGDFRQIGELSSTT